jgi:hypothetical protein
MPAFPFSRIFTANQLGLNPLVGWQYEFVPAAWGRGAAVKLLARSTTVGNRLTIFSGAQTIQQRAPVQGGGTIGVTPSELNTSPVTWIAQPGDRIILDFDEVAGGTPTVDGIIFIEPM